MLVSSLGVPRPRDLRSEVALRSKPAGIMSRCQSLCRRERPDQAPEADPIRSVPVVAPSQCCP
jgi:hypothetical protein